SFAIVAFVVILAACGGGGGSGSDAPASDSSITTFHAYAAMHDSGTNTSSSLQLSDAERTEVANLSRHWLAATLIDGNQIIATPNAVAISPLYFARVEAVTSAAYGTTLAQIQQAVPTPSSALVQAALMNGIARTISAAADSNIKKEFMDTVTANGQQGTWASLAILPLSQADIALEPNLHLRIDDGYVTQVSWPQAQTFQGVFEAASGSRVQTTLLRISGQTLVVTDATADVVALALPQNRWLVRITPVASINTWSVDDLEHAISNATTAIATQGTQALAQGNIVLPNSATFDSLGVYDLRGMGEAQDPVHADLWRIDGQGGTYASLTGNASSLYINSQGLTVSGSSSAEFIFSPDNVNGPGYGSVISIENVPLWVNCAATDLRPSYLVLINRYSGVDMLARFASLEGSPCN
ncbi:MAG: hypothetical protein ACXWJK_06335, partial [Burkholderiaceae bacterium]